MSTTRKSSKLRRKLYPSRDQYHLVASSVTEPAWLAGLPRNRPTVVVAEGLTPYLPAEQGPQLFARLVSHLASGELMFDAYSRFGLKLLRLSPPVKATCAEVHWAIEDPHELERAIPKLRFVEDMPAYKPEHAIGMRWSSRLVIRLWRHIPALRKVGRLLRYRF